MTKLSERMLRDLHVGIGDIVLSDIINEASALEARIEELEKRLERAEELLRRSGGMTTGEWNDAVAAVLWNPPPAALRSEEER